MLARQVGAEVYGQLPDERLEFAWEQEHVRVFVYLVRLGAIFDAA
ncbi:hypothetical protein [Candidatus Amarolinea dominans]